MTTQTAPQASPAKPAKPAPRTAAQLRTFRMRAVFAACKKLGLPDDARRAVVLQVTGHRSLADCSLRDLDAVVNHLNRRTGPIAQRPANPWAFVFDAAADRKPLLKKLYRLAERLGKLQTPPVPVMPPHYIEGIAAQMLQCDTRLQFCDADLLWRMVAALEKHLKRHGG